MSAPLPLVAGDTYEWTLDQAKKNGVVWDLTGATVTIIFESPDGVVAEFAVTSLYDPANGRAKRVGTGAELTGPGVWRRSWKVVQGLVSVRYPPIKFVVVEVF